MRSFGVAPFGHLRPPFLHLNFYGGAASSLVFHHGSDIIIPKPPSSKTISFYHLLFFLSRKEKGITAYIALLFFLFCVTCLSQAPCNGAVQDKLLISSY